MKVLLIYPGIGVTGIAPNYSNGETAWIQHGIGLIATRAKQLGFNISFMDMRRLASWEDFDNQVTNLKPDVAGISISYLDYHSSLEAIDRIKKIKTNCKIVVGGMLPTNFTDIIEQNKQIDHIVVGEGEISFIELLEELEQGRQPDRIIKGKTPDLDNLPFIDREIFDYNQELRCSFVPDATIPTVTMIAGRGCPYR